MEVGCNVRVEINTISCFSQTGTDYPIPFEAMIHYPILRKSPSPYLLLLLLFGSALTPQLVTADLLSIPSDERTFVYAVERSLFSQYLMEERRVYIYLPSGYETSDETYPVIYVTDGDWHIHHLSGVVGFLSGSNQIPKSILVAIPHQNRNSDLLPQPMHTGYSGGNAENFLGFLENELIPAIDQTYRTQKFKVLAGHSYGGLFTTWVMVANGGGKFNGYIAADPSLWWDGNRLINEAETLFTQQPQYGPFYYFDQSILQNMGGTVMAERLQTLRGSALHWKFQRMADETHDTIVHKSYYDGLQFVFETWPFDQVAFHPEGGLFKPGDSIEVTLSHPRESEGVIRYTTDGSTPTSSSPIYTEALHLSSTTVLRASVFLGNDQASSPTKGTFAEAVRMPAITPKHEIKPGLNYQLFAGRWEQLPDFARLQPIETGIKVGVELYQWRARDNFALQYTGYFYAETEGVYTFSLISDDGSRLLLDEIEIILNDGLHASQEVKGYAWLEKGYHSFEVQYFELGGDEALNLLYLRPGTTYPTSVPNRLFFH